MTTYQWSLKKPKTTEERKQPPLDVTLLPASEFSYAQLTDLYNRTRVDYLVPMPMNEKKLREYAYNYDTVLEHSVVAVLGDETLGLGMLGVRGDKTWITRLGVVPEGRKRRVGWKLMDSLIRNSQQTGAKEIALEVIKNNKPAENLFLKYGFQYVRELLVIRRPPSPINVITQGAYVETLGYREALELLQTRADVPSWVTTTGSMRNAGNLTGLYADLPDGSRGWLVYQNTVFQLARLVIKVETGDPHKVTTALLENLHWRHPIQDTVCENIPADSPYWPAMRNMGYIISFERFEMRKLTLRSSVVTA